MNYDFLIFGNWSNTFLWVVFAGIIIFYILNKYKFDIENFSDSRLKYFFIIVILFLLYYVFVYDPKRNVIQNLFLNSFATKSVNLSVNLTPFLGIILIIILGVVFFTIYKLVSSKFIKAVKKS